MGLSENIAKVLEDFGTKIKDDLQQSLRDKDVTYNGNDSRLSAKIAFEVKQLQGSVTFKLLMPEYGEALDKA